MEHVIFNQHYEKLQQYKKDQVIKDSEVKQREVGLKNVISTKNEEIGTLTTSVVELKQDLKASERTGESLKVRLRNVLQRMFLMIVFLDMI